MPTPRGQSPLFYLIYFKKLRICFQVRNKCDCSKDCQSFFSSSSARTPTEATTELATESTSEIPTESTTEYKNTTTTKLPLFIPQSENCTGRDAAANLNITESTALLFSANATIERLTEELRVCNEAKNDMEREAASNATLILSLRRDLNHLNESFQALNLTFFTDLRNAEGRKNNLLTFEESMKNCVNKRNKLQKLVFFSAAYNVSVNATLKEMRQQIEDLQEDSSMLSAVMELIDLRARVRFGAERLGVILVDKKNADEFLAEIFANEDMDEEQWITQRTLIRSRMEKEVLELDLRSFVPLDVEYLDKDLGIIFDEIRLMVKKSGDEKKTCCYRAEEAERKEKDIMEAYRQVSLMVDGYMAFVGPVRNLKSGIVECGFAEAPGLDQDSKNFLTEDFWSESNTSSKKKKNSAFPFRTTPDGKAIIFDPECPSLDSENLKNCLDFILLHGSLKKFVQESKNSTMVLKNEFNKNREQLSARYASRSSDMKKMYEEKIRKLTESNDSLWTCAILGWTVVFVILVGAFLVDRILHCVRPNVDEENYNA